MACVRQRKSRVLFTTPSRLCATPPPNNPRPSSVTDFDHERTTEVLYGGELKCWLVGS
jgi:hypothetical protein